ncbi:serine hydrolase [Embleya scabrispora]|uniref:serine hydrolase n=1 Tax=Embleya scabrispora TaxID=159449 RepID=UPI0003726DF6|nr:serine hydrolase [Embleya scabrispora]
MTQNDRFSSVWDRCGGGQERFVIDRGRRGESDTHSHVAPTEQRLTGAPRIWGGVHDDNAALLGGTAGHAGTFTTANDLAGYAEHLLDPEHPLHTWLTTSRAPQAPIEPGLDRGLAWLVADDGNVVYHHGWTGTSLFLAPTTGRYIAICTNAVYHGPPGPRLASLRTLARKTITAT